MLVVEPAGDELQDIRGKLQLLAAHGCAKASLVGGWSYQTQSA
jgi:hypothetical protein